MKAPRSIISQGQALQILKNDLRKQALAKRAAELSAASPERRSEIMAQIDKAIAKALRKRTGFFSDIFLH